MDSGVGVHVGDFTVGIVGALLGLLDGVAVGVEGLLDEGLFVGTRLGLDGLPLAGRLEGPLDALVRWISALPYEYRGIIECKHIDKYSTC
jgi:hypothetical protein